MSHYNRVVTNLSGGLQHLVDRLVNTCTDSVKPLLWD